MKAQGRSIRNGPGEVKGTRMTIHLTHSEKAGRIVLSNFGEIWVYDMEERKPEPIKFYLSEIQTKYSQFESLINKEQKR